METIFIILLSFILYSYIGYPIIIRIYSIFFKKSIDKSFILPDISIVIAARNEEKNIENRIYNIIEQKYPKNKLELIIVNDGSSDNTSVILDDLQVKLNTKLLSNGTTFKVESNYPSKGKPASINKGVSVATSDIIVFADCRQSFKDDAIQQLINNFSDKRVGCVSGELIFVEKYGSNIQLEMGTYWNFEKWLRKLESDIDSVPGATGAIYAIRKDLFSPIPEETLLDDVLIPMNIVIQGYRVIFDSKAIAFDVISTDISQEKKRKIRTLAGNWQILKLKPAILNPFKNTIFIQFLSHKVCRLLVPYSFLFALVISFFLKSLLAISFIGMTFLCVVIAFFPESPKRLSALYKAKKVIYTVFTLNYFAFIAPFRLILSKKNIW